MNIKIRPILALSLMFGTVLALALLAAPAQANAVIASASGDSQLQIHDMFGFELIEVRVNTFRVNKSADGSVRGEYAQRSLDDGQPFYVRGPLTCLNVIDNRAWVGGLIADSSEPAIIGWEMWFQVEDNGDGRQANPDWTTLIGASPVEGSAQEYCDDAPAVNFPFDINKGNIEVGD